MTELLHSVCPHDCPGACALQVTVEGGRITDVVGDPTHPFTQGLICGKVHNYTERVYSPLRVLTPLKRVGEKGAGEFEPISWDEALEEITHRFTRILAVYGGEAIIPFSYGGTLGLIQYYAGHPFFHALGATQQERTICIATAYTGWRYTLGAVLGADTEEMPEAKLVILWGINASATHINLLPFVKRARSRGARIVCIDPYRTRTAKLADEHIMLRPATDTALALGMMHVLINAGLVDRAYLQRAAVGFEQLAAHVQLYPPERVAAITGISAERIVELAHSYGGTKQSFIRVGIGPSRQENGGMACRTIACLPALTGAWTVPGGGALLSSSGGFPINYAALEARELMEKPTRVVNMIELGKALMELEHPPIKALYVYNSNPACVVPNQELVLQGLAREDLFVVVHEQVLTDTTDWADIVLPATTSMEHPDLYKSYGHYHLQLADPVIPPVGEAKSNHEVFRLLSRAMGVKSPILRESVEEKIRKALHTPELRALGVTYEQLRKDRTIRVQPSPFLPFANGAPTPSGKIELFSEQMERDNLPPLPTYVPLVEGPDNPAVVGRYPLQLMVPPNHGFLNSSFSQSELQRRKEGRPTILLHPVDAEKRGIVKGDLVAAYNNRGRCLLYAEVGEDTQVGVAIVQGIWWHKFSPGGRGINVLTSERVTDMGRGPAFHSNMVEVIRVNGR